MKLLNLADGTLTLHFQDRIYGRLTCSPAAPAAPDYAGAAQAQGAANLDAARAQGQINNPNTITPYGTQTVTWGSGFDEQGYNAALDAYHNSRDQHLRQYGSYGPYVAPDRNLFIRGNPDQPTLTQTFSPEQQAIFDQSNRTKLQLGQLGEQGATALQGVVGTGVDFSGTPAAPGSATDTRDRVYGAHMARVNEDVDRTREQSNADLIAAGIRPGTKAYDDRMALLERTRTDAANQAWLSSGQEMTRDFQTDTQRRKDAIAELLVQRQTPLNEVTAILSGSQVQNPFAMPGYAQNAQVAPAPVFGATQLTGDWNQGLYNLDAANQGNLQQGLFGLGGAGLMAGAMYM